MTTSPECCPVPCLRRGADRGADVLTRTEWVLADGLGGYAMGTALGTPTRRYHALLVAALSPPVNRHVMLNALADTLTADSARVSGPPRHLTTFHFGESGQAPGLPHGFTRFEKDHVCRWVFEFDDTSVTRQVERGRQCPATRVRYMLRTGSSPIRLTVRPLVSLRDAHTLLHAHDGLPPAIDSASGREVCVVRGPLRLHLAADSGHFHADPQWWYAFQYPRERERGLDCHEDLFAPGVFVLEVPARRQATLTIEALADHRPRPRRSGSSCSPEPVEASTRQEALVRGALSAVPAVLSAADAQIIAQLALAADDFIVRRVAGSGSSLRTIVAGYPWFTDWGRDAMISLPGLLLAVGRQRDAAAVLETFARHRRRGLIPNHFDDRTGQARYNAADASLWFIRAVLAYHAVCGHDSLLVDELLPACLDIVAAYTDGTDFGIGMDHADALITAGDATTQLTWMDAAVGGVPVTPRHGKAIEINALWHHALVHLAALARPHQPAQAERLGALARRVAQSLRAHFWNEARQCLYDVLVPGGDGRWMPDARIRPNQIFAVSLPPSPLHPVQQRAVLRTVQAHLHTPRGLRTLSPEDPGYQGRYEGDMARRDRAYHNGTAWPWLLGPFAEAILRVGGFSPESREAARRVLDPLIAELDGPSLGHLHEVYDGDDTPARPQQPDGCPAQAWSVAEILRVLLLILGWPRHDPGSAVTP